MIEIIFNYFDCCYLLFFEIPASTLFACDNVMLR